MHTDLTHGKPLTCSQCGSTNAVKPLNSRSVAVRCLDCGHTKLTREAEQREQEERMRELGVDFNKMWSDSRDRENLF